MAVGMKAVLSYLIEVGIAMHSLSISGASPRQTIACQLRIEDCHPEGEAANSQQPASSIQHPAPIIMVMKMMDSKREDKMHESIAGHMRTIARWGEVAVKPVLRQDGKVKVSSSWTESPCH